MANTTPSLPEPPKGSVLHVHHNRDLALQKYLLLQEEHDHLRQHLELLQTLGASHAFFSPPVSPTRASYPSSSAISSGQTTPYQSRSPSLSRVHGQGQDRRSSLSAITRPTSCAAVAASSCLETVIDESTVAELVAEETRLCHVNEGIKRVLTELLNCEAVRDDRALRTWVQCRLMETEKELRTGRRRRSAPEPCLAV
ncbi:hypothetical protein NKR19_g3797 [Coniochaeta hoffmannii]|uniref:Uncharacterized protein n=1 Tax=Coniochaeta hoffmannii TaxID=91930 RepID=A0AA38S6I6_9PEZI|nr:hypothetical protein NKR19_g3797 [Coniochaeta hoffmannii]